jgi:hypothetical protein
MDENKNLINNQSTVGKMAKAGAIFLALWGILHVWVGYEGIHRYLTMDIGGMWNMVAGGSNAPHNLIQVTNDAITANLQKHLLLNFCMDVGGFGVLGLILAWVIYNRGSWIAYFIALIAIGICDLSFTFSLVTSGIIEPNIPTISGPIIWVIAMGLIPFGLSSLTKK